MDGLDITYFNNMKIFPANTGTSLRSTKDVLNHLLIDYTIASIATYAFCSTYELIPNLLRSLDTKYGVNKLFNTKEKDLIADIYNMKLDKYEIDNNTYRFEKCYLYLWALGFVDSIYYDEKCSVKKINDILLSSSNYDDLLNKCKLIETDKMFEYFNVLSKINYSNVNLDKVSKKVIEFQSEALNYILFYNPNRNSIRIIYNIDDLRFELLVPSYIIFDKVSSTSKELLALRSKTGGIKIVLQDLKMVNIQDNIKAMMKSFEIADIGSINSIYLDKKIIKVKFVKNNLSINTYYMLINGHLLRMDSLSGKENIDTDILLSLKMF